MDKGENEMKYDFEMPKYKMFQRVYYPDYRLDEVRPFDIEEIEIKVSAYYNGSGIPETSTDIYYKNDFSVIMAEDNIYKTKKEAERFIEQRRKIFPKIKCKTCGHISEKK